MEAQAKQKTNDVVASLNKLAPKTATLVTLDPQTGETSVKNGQIEGLA